MAENGDPLRSVVLQALSGRGAHALVRESIEGLDWQVAGARPAGATHSVFQVVNHLIYWQSFSLAWIDGDKPPTPEHAALSWPGAAAPADESEWTERVITFQSGLETLESRARELDLYEARGAKTVLEILQLIASHNSYHLGQIAWARQTLGAWPPPAGGATW